MPSRRSPRLPTYDYRQPGWYFVTVCTRDRAPIFGEVLGGEMHLSEAGQIAREAWRRSFGLRPYLVPDAFVVMPDHVHLLFGLLPADAVPPDDGTALANGAAPTGGRDAHTADARSRGRDVMHHVPTPDMAAGGWPRRTFAAPARRSVSSIVACYKADVARQVGRLWGGSGAGLWQGRFHDRVVRSDAERDRIRRYIDENPMRWHLRRQ